MFKKLLFLCFFFIGFLAQSQIVNIENLRRVTDTSGWSGNVTLKLQLTKNKNKLFNLSNKISLQHKKENHLWLFVNDFSIQEANSSKLVNKGLQHVRYNYKLNKKYTWEAFLQAQYDDVSQIRFRGLIGSGIRFKLSKSENYKYYFGSLLMYEHENSLGENGTVIYDNFRGSWYFSFSLYPSKNTTIISTTYYQPKLSKFIDYRIASENSIILKITKNLSFIASYTYLFDEFPAFGIPKTQYKLTNGLSYSFD